MSTTTKTIKWIATIFLGTTTTKKNAKKFTVKYLLATSKCIVSSKTATSTKTKRNNAHTRTPKYSR